MDCIAGKQCTAKLVLPVRGTTTLNPVPASPQTDGAIRGTLDPEYEILDINWEDGDRQMDRPAER